MSSERAGYITVRVPIDGDPNVLGETLREALFKPAPDGEWSYGCYTTFEVRDDAEQIDSAIAQDFFAPTDPEERDWWMGDLPTDWFYGYRWQSDGFTFEGFWYWDGDGTLAFRIYEGDELIRTLINTDCKKAHYWEDRRGR